jgi:BCCT family betaine/carnitine transporter
MQQNTETDYDTDYTEGQHNIRPFGLELHNPVFFISSTLIVIFVVATLMFPAGAKEQLDATKSWSIENFDWLFMAGGNLFVLFCLILIFLPVGLAGGKNSSRW